MSSCVCFESGKMFSSLLDLRQNRWISPIHFANHVAAQDVKSGTTGLGRTDVQVFLQRTQQDCRDFLLLLLIFGKGLSVMGETTQLLVLPAATGLSNALTFQFYFQRITSTKSVVSIFFISHI